MNNKIVFGNELRRIRETLLLSYVKASALSGIPLQTIKNWERYINIPTQKSISIYIDFMASQGVSSEELRRLKELYGLCKIANKIPQTDKPKKEEEVKVIRL